MLATVLVAELMRSRLGGGAPFEDVEDAAEGKNRFGGAQEGRSWSSLFRMDSEEKAGALAPLPKNAASASPSTVGVPGMELFGVEKGELAE